MSTFDTIIFDLGGVLIDWNPEYLYRKILPDEKERAYFLTKVCSSGWNVQQDAGRPLAEATQILVEQFPHYEAAIRAFYGRWTEMLGGVEEGTLQILEDLYQTGSHRLYALTNWSAETFPIARRRYPFLQYFEGILVSGEERMKKPDREIYQLLLSRYGIPAKRAVFIDDSLKNVQGALACGIHGIHFQSPGQLASDLQRLGLF